MATIRERPLKDGSASFTGIITRTIDGERYQETKTDAKRKLVAAWRRRPGSDEGGVEEICKHWPSTLLRVAGAPSGQMAAAKSGPKIEIRPSCLICANAKHRNPPVAQPQRMPPAAASERAINRLQVAHMTHVLIVSLLKLNMNPSPSCPRWAISLPLWSRRWAFLALLWCTNRFSRP